MIEEPGMSAKSYGNGACYMIWDVRRLDEFGAMLAIADSLLTDDEKVRRFNDAAQGFRISRAPLDEDLPFYQSNDADYYQAVGDLHNVIDKLLGTIIELGDALDAMDKLD